MFVIDITDDHFDDVFTFDGNRALILPAKGPLPRVPLTLCLRAALTYHRRKREDLAPPE